MTDESGRWALNELAQARHDVKTLKIIIVGHTSRFPHGVPFTEDELEREMGRVFSEAANDLWIEVSKDKTTASTNVGKTEDEMPERPDISALTDRDRRILSALEEKAGHS